MSCVCRCRALVRSSHRALSASGKSGTFLSFLRTQNVDYFKNYLTDLHNSTGKPIWLTEVRRCASPTMNEELTLPFQFAGSGTVAEQQTFLETVIPWMEKSAFIERYAAFGAAPTVRHLGSTDFSLSAR